MKKKQKDQIRKNISVIRNYLGMSIREFSNFTGVDYKRCSELETRFSASEEEINKIAKACEVNPKHIKNNILFLTLNIQ